jgi:hypothetical protein
MNQFEIGKTYECHSPADWDCVFTFRVVGRSAKFVTIEAGILNGRKRRGIKVNDEGEFVWPFGDPMRGTCRAENVA